MKIKEFTPIPQQAERKKTAAYARVSCSKEEMLHSLAAQVSHYSGYIQHHPGWDYAGVYADSALTGTKDSRPEFQRLLADCRAGLIDVVLTKSISRFARNTVTLLETVRELKSLGVDVFFEEQNIHSLSCEGELLLTILAGYAQEESKSVSDNCKWRIRRNFEEGKPYGMKTMLGYRIENGEFTIMEDEAEAVRQIYALYLSGKGVLAIMKTTAAQGLKLSQSGVEYILRNTTYTGDLLLQKTFSSDHITKRKVFNNGELPQFHVEGNHEPIISKATFEAVQVEIARRAANYRPKAKAPPTFYPFTGLIKCGICGAAYRRKHANAGSKYEKIVWICETYNTLGKSSCASQQIPEDILLEKVNEAGGMENIAEIIVPDKFRLTFILKDGTRHETEWRHRSRSESWTEEMKQQAAERTKKGGGRNG